MPGLPDGPGVLEEIPRRVRAIGEWGGSVLPPVLLLGVMERVGSNWVSDTLRPVTGQHNEPFRQQVSPAREHPVVAVPATGDVIDLGAPEAPAPVRRCAP
jgi:hypothetical protein